MEDRLLVETLRSREPDAIGEVYDAHADRLYAYCWFQLRNRDAAALALRDTLMCAEAYVGELRAPARFRPWLYALARIEWHRRRTSAPVEPDVPVARHDQDDVDLRVMAWRAVDALPPLGRELLDLRHRHELTVGDIADVVGLPAKEVDDLLDRARAMLADAVTAEILAYHGPYECAGRTALLRRHGGGLDDDLRDALVRHAAECDACARHLPKTVSAAKVYDALPRVLPPPPLRAEVMSCFTDPELAGYRLFAAARMPGVDAHGFPDQPGAGRSARAASGLGRWARALIALTGALCVAGVAVGVVRHLGTAAPYGRSTTADPGPRVTGGQVPRPAPSGIGRSASATMPYAVRRDPGPVAVMGLVPLGGVMAAPRVGRLVVTPGRLDLRSGGAGTIALRAMGGDVSWHASTTGPIRPAPGDGELREGDVRTVTVQAPADGPGNALLTFQPGGTQVRICWGDRSSGFPTSPTPTSPAPTGRASASPAPSSSAPAPATPKAATRKATTSKATSPAPSPAPSGPARSSQTPPSPASTRTQAGRAPSRASPDPAGPMPGPASSRPRSTGTPASPRGPEPAQPDTAGPPSAPKRRISDAASSARP